MNFERVRCFIMDDKFGNSNDFVDEDFKSDYGIVLTLEETVKYQKDHNKPILVYENTDKELIKYFIKIGGKISN